VFVKLWGHVSYPKPNDLPWLMKWHYMYVYICVCKRRPWFLRKRKRVFHQTQHFLLIYTFLRSLFPPYFLHCHSLPFSIFLLSVLSVLPTAHHTMTATLLACYASCPNSICFLYNTTIPYKHLMFLGLYHLNIYHLKRHHNSVNLNFFTMLQKN
jgi:hypothetical protein